MRASGNSPLIALLVGAITACLLAGVSCFKTNAATPWFWPDDAEGALSLTFDDGMPSQLERAVPVLDRHGLKATFYVNPGFSVDWYANLHRWRDVSRQGHEIGNHTDTHPCSCQSNFRHGGDYCLERLDLTEIARSIEHAERALATLTQQPIEARSFAYPCYNSDVGAGPTRISYVPEVAKRYSAARIGLQQPADNDPETVELSYVASFSAEAQTAEEMIAYIESAVKRGRWAVIVFHGIGDEWNATDTRHFDGLMDYLSKNRPRIWVAPFVQVANYVRATRVPPYRK